jgi:hypothetical protein
MTPIAPAPGGVAMATIVSVSARPVEDEAALTPS